MSKLGFGVMIRRLGGNASTVGAYHKAMGQVIESVRLVDDELRIRFVGGDSLKVSDEGQSCCESRYMKTDYNLEDFAGATLQSMELKEAPRNESEDGDCHEVQFLEVTTSAGEFVMSSHNDHNGYYGGFSIELAYTEAATG